MEAGDPENPWMRRAPIGPASKRNGSAPGIALAVTIGRGRGPASPSGVIAEELEGHEHGEEASGGHQDHQSDHERPLQQSELGNHPVFASGFRAASVST
jgi:hypothetical protein